MNLKQLFRGTDIHTGLEQFRNTPGAVLLDVRTPEEYAQGHLPGSINLPLQNIFRVTEEVPEQGTPVFLYCHSGARSRRAAAFLEKLGYENVCNLGGISGYSGKLDLR